MVLALYMYDSRRLVHSYTRRIAIICAHTKIFNLLNIVLCNRKGEMQLGRAKYDEFVFFTNFYMGLSR